MLTADRMKSGIEATILSVDCKGLLKRRLYEMGFTPGASIVFVKKAPLGDPLEFAVRDYRVAIRVSTAKKIMVSYNKSGWLKRRFYL